MKFEKVKLLGQDLMLADYPGSDALDIIASEINAGYYQLDDIDFQEGDVVVDIGAHIGMISILLAKKYPFLQILAYEPMPQTFKYLVGNVTENQVYDRVTINNIALTGDGRTIPRMIGNLADNSGGSTIQLKDMNLPGHQIALDVPSVTLDSILEPLKAIKLLKIDCEGSEHEVLNSLSDHNWKKIANIRGEFHINQNLNSKGYSIDSLLDLCRRHVGNNVKITKCKMAE